MENSRRINNPDNFNEDGTIKIIENRKPLVWKNTNNYKRLRRKRKYLVTKFANQRKNLYEKQVNELISKGDKFIVEPMDYKKLQNSKNKKTEIDENGRYKKKVRFGKSIGNHAPSLFLSILSRKLGYIQIKLDKVDISTYRASQYNHITGEYTKSNLDERIKEIGNYKIQRDLYSAFLLMNASDNLKEIDNKKCNDTFERFISLHNIEIERLRRQQNISCIGI